MLKVVAHDARERRLQRLLAIYEDGTNREVLALEELMANRIEGLPTKKVERRAFHHSTFVFTTKDGEQIPVLPPRERARSGAPPASATEQADAALILAGQRVVPW